MKKIYFSYAYTTPVKLAEEIKLKLINMGVDLSFYMKGTEYSDQPIRDCDIFCIFLPSNAFEAQISQLSTGIQKELSLAVRLKKKIILAYLSQKAGLTFYLVDISKGIISGIAGTNSDVIKIIEGEEEIKAGNADQIDNLDWLSKPSIKIIL